MMRSITRGVAGSERSVNVNLSTGQAVITQNGLTYNDTVLNIEGVEGSNGNDIIVGSDGANSLDGRKGADEIDGGLGFDFVEYNGLFSEIVEVNLETGIAKDGHGFTDTLSNIEGVIGSNGNDIFTGKVELITSSTASKASMYSSLMVPLKIMK